MSAFRSLVIAAGLGAAASAACHLSGDISGEELTDAGSRALVDLTLCVPIPDAHPDAGADGGAVTWTSLYTDYFGPTGAASCSSKSFCHGRDALADKNSGANNGAGIHCFDREGCRQSWIDKKLVTPEVVKTPANANAFSVLRVCRPPTTDGGDFKAIGIMPQQPSNLTFSDTAVGQIQDWIRQGFPDN